MLHFRHVGWEHLLCLLGLLGPSPVASARGCRAVPALQKVWLEFWRQTQLALLMLLIFGVVSWLIRGRPPWEGAPRGAAPAGPVSQGGLAGEQEAADPHVDL